MKNLILTTVLLLSFLCAPIGLKCNAAAQGNGTGSNNANPNNNGKGTDGNEGNGNGNNEEEDSTPINGVWWMVGLTVAGAAVIKMKKEYERVQNS